MKKICQKNIVICLACCCIISILSCKQSHDNIIIPEVFVNGGDAVVGDGKLYSPYEYKVESLFAAKYEFTWEMMASVLNYGLENGSLEIKKNNIYPLVGRFPQIYNTVMDLNLNKEFLHIADNKIELNIDKKDFPVTNVGWFAIALICNILSEMNNYTPCYETLTWQLIEGADGYRLPTFEEWEYIAKGGLDTKHYSYSGSNDPYEVGWFRENSDKKIHPVGMLEPNELGIYDLSGNVHEYCTDTQKPLISSGAGRLMIANFIWRGGAFKSKAVDVFAFIQSANYPDYLFPFDDVGFRTVRSR